MSGLRDNSDDGLLDQLRAAFDTNVPVPPSMVDMIMAGYDITNIEAHIAALTEDSRLADSAGVRSGPSASPRLLAFEFEDLRFEFELRSDAPQIIGHLDGVSGGALHFEQADRSEPVTLDENGAFEFSTGSSAPFRLRYEPPTGPPIATEWILP